MPHRLGQLPQTTERAARSIQPWRRVGRRHRHCMTASRAEGVDEHQRPGGTMNMQSANPKTNPKTNTMRSAIALAIWLCVGVGGDAWAQCTNTPLPAAGIGPVNPANGYPRYYVDASGLALGPCFDLAGNCPLMPDALPNPLAPISFPAY